MGLRDLLRSKEEEYRAINLPDYDAGSLSLYASQLLDNPVYNKVILDIRNDCMVTWQNTVMGDVEGREDLYNTFRLLNLIDTRIRNVAQSAQLKAHSNKAKLTVV